MKYCGVGGQAVMEGVMMKNGADYAVAVRTPEGTIEVTKKRQKHNRDKINKIPLLRGVVAFIDSLSLGISTLMISASYFEDEEEAEKEREEKSKLSDEEIDDYMAKKDRKEKIEMTSTVILSFLIALVVFFFAPYFLSKLLTNWIGNTTLLALVEGIIRVAIFVGYVALISKMEDIKRVFMYHGAEHKCINCIESGKELTVSNVKSSSRLHKRCGTSFLLIVLIISIFVFMFIRFDNTFIQILLRLALIPVIAGVSYEVLKIMGRFDNKFIDVVSAPGLWVQRLTTREPDDSMIEVGIRSVEEVFDWRSFIETIEQ